MTHAATLTGKIGHHEVPAQLARMDVGVAPYPPMSPFYFSPLKIVEYMAAGVPIVASDQGQIATVVQHGRTGYLCAPGDPEAFAIRILELAADPSACDAMGRRAREHVLQFHTWDAGVRQVLERAGFHSAEAGKGVVVP